MAGICHVVDVDWLSGTDPAGGFLGGSDTYFCPKETRVDGGNNHARPGNRPLRRGNNHIHDANNCVAYINNDVRPGHDRVRSGNNRLAFGNDRWRLFDTVNSQFQPKIEAQSLRRPKRNALTIILLVCESTVWNLRSTVSHGTVTIF